MGTTGKMIEIILNAFFVWHLMERGSEESGMFQFDTYFSVSNCSTSLEQSILLDDPVGNCDHIPLPKPSS